MTLAEVRAEIDRLQRLKRELEDEEREAYKEIAQKFVGRCYRKGDGTVFKIVSVPIESWSGHGTVFNEYQFPAIFLEYPEKLKPRYYKTPRPIDEYVPCYGDTVYLDVNKGVPGNNNWSCEEIASEEFDTEFDKCIEYYKELIGIYESKSKQPMSKAEFIDRYCGPCGTQRCGGPDDELYSEGCQYFKDWREGRI